jgi:hypothetical protein
LQGLFPREPEQDAVRAPVADIDHADSIDRRDAAGHHLGEMVEIAAVVSIQNIEREADVDVLCDQVFAQRRIKVCFCHSLPALLGC